MRRRKLVVTVTAMVLVTGAVGMAVVFNRNQPTGSATEPVGNPGGLRMVTPPRSDEERARSAEEWGDKFKDPALARRAFPPLKVPNNNLGRTTIGIFVEKAAKPNEKRAAILYEKGLFISEQMEPEDIVPDYEKELEQFVKAKGDGILKSDTLPVLVKVNGRPGLGAEPGYNIVRGEKLPRPGFVAWFDSGISYYVHGDDIRLDDLLKVAESTY